MMSPKTIPLAELRLQYALEQAALDNRLDAEIARQYRSREPIRAMYRHELSRLTRGKTLTKAELSLSARVARLNVATRIAS